VNFRVSSAISYTCDILSNLARQTWVKKNYKNLARQNDIKGNHTYICAVWHARTRLSLARQIK